MKKQCPFGECEKCYWFRPWDYEERDSNGGKTGKVVRNDVCSLDVLLDYIPKIVGAVDGCQAAANESRNYVLAMARGLAGNGIDGPARILTHQLKGPQNGFENGKTRSLLES